MRSAFAVRLVLAPLELSVPDVRLPNVLRQHAGGAKSLTVDADTVGELLVALEASHPGMQGQLLNADGSAHKFINVYVDDEDVRYIGGLDAKIGPDSEVALLPAVAGG